MDYGTIKIPREEYERHNQRRQELDQTWAAYIDGEAPELGMHVELDGAVATAEDIKDLQVLLEGIPRKTAERITDEDVPPGIVEMANANQEQLDEIRARMKELQDNLPSNTAKRVADEMR